VDDACSESAIAQPMFGTVFIRRLTQIVERFDGSPGAENIADYRGEIIER
jgi:hypothetical protein